MVSRGRRIDTRGREVDVHRAELAPEDVEDGITMPEVTLAHCLRRLPFDEALAIADSALRSGVPASRADPDRRRVRRDPAHRRCAGSRSVPAHDAANPFESVLRSIALDVPGLSVEPQVTIREPDIVARPDLVDWALRIVIEADSYEWHGGRAQLSADARRYDLLVVNGWLVLRFSYEHVMTQPDFVRRVLLAAVTLAERMREVGLLAGLAA